MQANDFSLDAATLESQELLLRAMGTFCLLFLHEKAVVAVSGLLIVHEKPAPKRLALLHKWLVKKLQLVDRWVRQVLPYGFLLRHAQHVCCELRKWKRRKQASMGRKRAGIALLLFFEALAPGRSRFSAGTVFGGPFVSRHFFDWPASLGPGSVWSRLFA